MPRLVVFVAGVWLIVRAAADSTEDTVNKDGNAQDGCQSFGNSFCSVKCVVPPNMNETFYCECPDSTKYFDAADKSCHSKISCKSTQCAIGKCEIKDSNEVGCSCKSAPNLTESCEVDSVFQRKCNDKGGQAAIHDKWTDGARCDCGDWAAMDDVKQKCVPTTCLHPAVTCRELCEKSLLDRDSRCCEGWDQNNCAKIPPDDSYCSPGTIRDDDGNCEDACSAHEARLVCPHGCRKLDGLDRPYECSCKEGSTLTEDGVTCKEVIKVRPCDETERLTCRQDETCIVEGQQVTCKCTDHQHVVNGVCTGKCTQNDCHERFLDCTVNYGKQECVCPWKHRNRGVPDERCALRQYYYTVSFKPNISLESQDCSTYASRVKPAMRTALGLLVHAVEIVDCTDRIKARLILNEPLAKPMVRKLQTCEYPIDNVCMLYPELPIEKGSATEIEEEDLCAEFLKEQENAYNGVNECVKDGDVFWFKCKPGYRELEKKELGRLRRSVCEVDPETTGPKLDPCLTIGAEACGSVPCEPSSDNSGFTCKCTVDFFFDASEKRCYNMKSCKVNKCERGLCVDQNGTFPASCQCNDYPELTLNCKVKEDVRKECEKKGMNAVINPDNSVSCVCPPGMKLLGGACKGIACLNPSLTCRDVCLLPERQRDRRCCQNWDPSHCDKKPPSGSFCQPGFIADPQSGKCTHVCNTPHALEICELGCNQLAKGSAEYSCKCAPDHQLGPDGVLCVERTTCHEEDVIKCSKDNKECIYENHKPVCRCPDNTIEHKGTCSETCISQKSILCSSLFGRCVIRNHRETCLCPPPLRWHDHKKKCYLDKLHKYVVRFRVNNVTARTTQYTFDECSDKHDMVEEAMKTAYGPPLTTIRVFECSDEYKVELNFKTEPPRVLLNKIRSCEHPEGDDGCFFPPSLHIVKGSVSEVVEEDLCETYLNNNLLFLDGLYKCKKVNNRHYALQCSEAYRRIASFSQGVLEIDICTEQQCEVYCKGPERLCVEGKCVCHHNFFLGPEGNCVPQCSRKPCKNGGTCETGVKTTFYCSCPPYFTGPTCEVPYEAYTDTQRKLTVVGVVFSVLIMLCLGTAAVIIRKVKNLDTRNEDL